MSEAGKENIFSQDYLKLTKKYKDALALGDNQLVAKTWVMSILDDEFMDGERKRLWGLGDEDLKAIQSILPFKKEEIGVMSSMQLCNLYTVQEMMNTDIASDPFSFQALKNKIEKIETIVVNTTKIDNPPAFATILTLK
jgi:hypothetical protein